MHKIFNVTCDYRHFIVLSNQGEAERLADCINGIVFFVYPTENLVIYRAGDNN